METQTRPRSKSTFSFRSSKSDKNGLQKPKIDLTETDADKKRSRFSNKSKVNPNQAINEAQPSGLFFPGGDIAALNDVGLTSGSMQLSEHKRQQLLAP